MALLTCPECTHPVSSKASACPHCGMPMLRGGSGQSTLPASSPSDAEKLSTSRLHGEPPQQAEPRFSIGADIALRTLLGVALLGLTTAVASVIIALLPGGIPPGFGVFIAIALWKPLYGSAVAKFRLRPAPLKIGERRGAVYTRIHRVTQWTLWSLIALCTAGAVLTIAFQTRGSELVCISVIALLFFAVLEMVLFAYFRQRIENPTFEIVVESHPPGARIEVDDTVVGIAPVTILVEGSPGRKFLSAWTRITASSTEHERARFTTFPPFAPIPKRVVFDMTAETESPGMDVAICS